MSDYKRNPRGARRARKSMSRKAIVVLSLMMVLVLAAVGGTVAWLADKTAPVVNTFTVGNIDIDLAESEDLNLKMVPGDPITKDPKVTVKANSEACWLFVKVEESEDPKLDDYISYTMANGWTALPDVDGVYYREVSATTADTPVDVLANNQVTVKETVTKSMMDELSAENATKPSLTFTAYAIQKDHFTTAAAAWAQIIKESFNSSGANIPTPTPAP